MKIKGLKSGEFKYLINSPSLIKTKNFIFKYKINTLNSKLSIIIRKRDYKLAVNRNYLRRVLKNIIIPQLKNSKNKYYIVLILKSNIQLDYYKIKDEIDKIITSAIK